MSTKQFSNKEKEATELTIELRLGRKMEIVKNPQTSDEEFISGLRDICSLNMMRDKINE